MGRNGTPPPEEDPEHLRQSEESRTLDDWQPELEAADQTLSDRDQTLGDRDQTLSDRDQQASDEDQAAADVDRDHGGDPTAYAETTMRRAARTQERDDVSALRDLTAQERDTAALRRDAISLLHDQAAESHDREAASADSEDSLADDRTLEIEEFAPVPAPGTIVSARCATARRRRTTAGGRRRTASRPPTWTSTVSSPSTRDGDDPQDLIDRADKDLLEARPIDRVELESAPAGLPHDRLRSPPCLRWADMHSTCGRCRKRTGSLSLGWS